MPRTILVGLNGSCNQSGAVDLGIQWSRRFGSLLVGIAIVDEPRIRGSHVKGNIPPSYRIAYDMQMDEERRKVEQTLEEFAILCSREEISSKLLEAEDDPCGKIMSEAERYDMLLFDRPAQATATHTRRTCDAMDHVLHCTPRPIVVVPERTTSGSGVLVAYDGSLQSARALQVFAASGLAELGPVHILTVHSESSVEAMRIADRATEFLAFHDIRAAPHPIVRRQDAGHAILEEAVELKVELLVMGVYGQPPIREFLLGSVTRTVLNDCQVPLFLYH